MVLSQATGMVGPPSRGEPASFVPLLCLPSANLANTRGRESYHVNEHSQVAVIVGFPRSGTTLLRTMLVGNPKLDVLEVETHYVLDLYRRFGYRLQDADAAIRELLGHPKFPEGLSQREEIHGLLSAANPSTLGVLLRRFFRLLFPGGNSTLVIKYPALVGHLDFLAQLFPNLVILNTIRDPRAAVSSHRARWPTNSVAEASLAWCDAVSGASRWAVTNRDAYAEVRYEELLLDPVPTLKVICELLEVDYCPAMTSLDYEDGQWDAATPGRERRHRFVSLETAKIDQWRTALDNPDLAVIEHICGTRMQELGYELVQPSLELHEQVQYRWRNFKGRGLSLARRLKARVLPA